MKVSSSKLLNLALLLLTGVALDVGAQAYPNRIITPSTPDAMSARIRSEFELFAPLVRKLNLAFDLA